MTREALKSENLTRINHLDADAARWVLGYLAGTLAVKVALDALDKDRAENEGAWAA